MHTRALAPTLIYVGVPAMASGILVEYRNPFIIGSDIGLALTVAGLLLSGIGVGIWARHASPIKVFLLALRMGIAASLLAEYGHIFTEGSTGISTLLFLAVGAGAVFLLVAAAARV